MWRSGSFAGFRRTCARPSGSRSGTISAWPDASSRPTAAAPDGRDARILHALEARHPSWMTEEAAVSLRAHDVALVWADTSGEHPATTSQTSEALAYVRLHGPQRIYEGHYSKDDLEAWAERGRAWALRGTNVHVYFDNDRDAAAPQDAIRLLALVEGRSDPGWTEQEQDSRRSEAGPRERPAHFAFRARRGQP